MHLKFTLLHFIYEYKITDYIQNAYKIIIYSLHTFHKFVEPGKSLAFILQYFCTR